MKYRYISFTKGGFFLLFLFASCYTAFAQKPTISSFTPASGPIGTQVTITGTNFSATAANNIVNFGATRATVTAANTTSLTVTVPAGATYQPISVLTNGLYALSKDSFVVTFKSDGSGISTSTFASPVDFNPGINPWAVKTADFDNDGKPDLAVTNTTFGTTISVLRNNSSSPSTISYDTKLAF